MPSDYVFTSESVTEGHPDKLCDQISDALVDRYLRRDRLTSIVTECAISTGIVFVAGRVSSQASVDIPDAVRDVLSRAGYVDGGYDVTNCTVMTSLTSVAPSARRLDEARMDDAQIDEVGVSNLSTCFGYACDHTPSMMPMPIYLAHRLARRISQVRREGVLPYLAPDAKTQVSVEFRERRPRRVHNLAIVASQQSREEPPLDRLRDDILEVVVRPELSESPAPIDRNSRLFINPAGPVIVGGPAIHSGMTGRKTGVDTYGEYARSSSSALSGKGADRIDRIGNYIARYAAKNVVAAGLARECEVQLSYSIGSAAPVSIQIDTFGTNTIAEQEIAARVLRNFDFRLAAIVRQFRLRDLPGRHTPGIFERLAVYGHLGREDLGVPWERTDIAERLRS
jgi:S-adenosylmethionine synthetase